MGFFSALTSIARSIAGRRPMSGRGGWFPMVREPFQGAWQQNAEIRAESVMGNPTVFACVDTIARDIGKLPLLLVKRDDDGIWAETENSAYSPVLRKPNRYQTPQTFLHQWLASKLLAGNTYVLKERDVVGLVRALYVLDPAKVAPLVAPDGQVYYELRRQDLAGLGVDVERLVVPASEIIHDLTVAPFHPLCGMTPLFACGLAALQANTIQQTSTKFFAGGSHPGGVLTAPGAIGDETAKRLKAYWETEFSGDNVGKVAVLGDGLKYEAMTVTASDAQLIEQLNWTASTICACYHVPAHLVGAGPVPPFGTVEALNQQYFAQCLQSHIVGVELALDEGLGLLGSPHGTELDINDLIWMDTATRTKAAADGIGSGALSPDEARRKYFGLGPVKGGATPYLQQQNYSLAALDARDRDDPFAKPAPAPAPAAAPVVDDAIDAEKGGDVLAGALAVALLRKDWHGLAATL